MAQTCKTKVKPTEEFDFEMAQFYYFNDADFTFCKKISKDAFL